MQYMVGQASDRELKKGSAELLILSLVQGRARHGYEIAKLIESRSKEHCPFKSPHCTHCFTGSKLAAGSRPDGSRKQANGDGATND
jgi:hypothetical protein